MVANSSEIESKITAASAAIDANPCLKASDTTRQFNALYYRLLQRRRGILPSHTRGGYNKKLSTVQD
jgi:hypothetical protein